GHIPAPPCPHKKPVPPGWEPVAPQRAGPVLARDCPAVPRWGRGPSLPAPQETPGCREAELAGAGAAGGPSGAPLRSRDDISVGLQAPPGTLGPAAAGESPPPLRGCACPRC